MTNLQILKRRTKCTQSFVAASLIFSIFASDIPLMVHNLLLVVIWIPCNKQTTDDQIYTNGHTTVYYYLANLHSTVIFGKCTITTHSVWINRQTLPAKLYRYIPSELSIWHWYAAIHKFCNMNQLLLIFTIR